MVFDVEWYHLRVKRLIIAPCAASNIGREDLYDYKIVQVDGKVQYQS